MNCFDTFFIFEVLILVFRIKKISKDNLVYYTDREEKMLQSNSY